MNNTLLIKTCPTCASDQIQLVAKDIVRKYKNQLYIVPAVEFYECANCGEKVYDKLAMRRIEEYSPAYRYEHRVVKA